MKKEDLRDFIEIDTKVMKILNKGLLFSLVIGLIGIILIIAYNTYPVTYDYFEGGFILTKTSFAFAAQVVGLGIIINNLIKEKV